MDQAIREYSTHTSQPKQMGVLGQTQKGSNKRLFILTRTHSMQMFREIPFIKPQNDTQTTDKRLKTMKN